MFNLSKKIRPRLGDVEHALSEEEFKRRYLQSFYDPNFSEMNGEITKLSDIAWKNYSQGRKAPQTMKAGEGYADPNYDLSLEWLDARKKIEKAQNEHQDPQGPNRILLISGSDRNDQTCPGEISKTMRLLRIAEEALKQHPRTVVEVLDLSRVNSEFGKTIHPCKGCVSTAMPLCHWPCSCYPNHSLGQIHDWMNDIYPMWARSHGIMILTPVYWHQAPSALKLMIDRLVCSDGGNDDPTTTQGKDPQLAKKIELQGWHYPRHLSKRLFSVIVHGAALGVDHLKSALTDWLEEMELIPVSTYATLGRYIGYYEPYATSHMALDAEENLQEEVRNAARALAMAVSSSRQHLLDSLNPPLDNPRPK